MSRLKDDRCFDTVVDLLLAELGGTVDVVLRDRTLKFKRIQ